jgi:isopentenyl diphosphate isomerase/L-lactate dehydrogenase-like FMN-dependent dehydrogenase
VILAPTGLSRLAGPEGEHAAAAAAHACGTVSVMSTSASVSLEDAARRAPSAQWFQLYPWADRAVTTSLIERARRAGYSLMMVTVDVPAAGGRERDQRVGMTVPPRVATDTVLDVARHPRWAWQRSAARRSPSPTWLRSSRTWGRGPPPWPNRAPR